MRSRLWKSTTTLAGLALTASLGLTACSSPEAPPAVSESVQQENATQDAPEAPAEVISLTELEQGDRAMQVEACNTLLGSPEEIAEKLGLPTAFLVEVESEINDSSAKPWREAATTKSVSNQIDLACLFRTEHQGTVYVSFGLPGDDGTNSFCESSSSVSVCVSSDDKQRVVVVTNHGAPPVNGTINEEPLRELLDRFGA